MCLNTLQLAYHEQTIILRIGIVVCMPVLGTSIRTFYFLSMCWKGNSNKIELYCLIYLSTYITYLPTSHPITQAYYCVKACTITPMRSMFNCDDFFAEKQTEKTSNYTKRLKKPSKRPQKSPQKSPQIPQKVSKVLQSSSKSSTRPQIPQKDLKTFSKSSKGP